MEEFVAGLLSISCLFFLICISRLLNSIWWKPKQLEKHLREQGIAGPSYRLLQGNLKENSLMIEEALSKPMNLTHDIAPRLLPFLCDIIKNYGMTSVQWFGTVPRVNIMAPELVKEILSNRSGDFEKLKPNPHTKLLAGGLAVYQGAKWAEHRRLLTPAFHLEKLKGMLPAYSVSCTELIERWQTLIGPGESYELNVWPEMKNLAGDVISRTAFGSSYKEGKQIFEIQSEQIKLHIKADRALYIPGLRFLPTKENQRRRELNKRVRTLLTAMIEKREKGMKEGRDSGAHDLLGLLLDAKRNGRNDYDEKIEITIEDVIGECKLFYFAGSDTTAALLTWTMVVLSMHPSWQDRARKEVVEVFGKRTPDIDGLSRLKSVTMILYEVLRLYPPATILIRHTEKQVKVGKLLLPPGIQVGMPIVLIHRDPRLWGEDAGEFNPERFANGVSMASKQPGAFFPFGWGQRICIGQNFGLMEAKTALAMVLQHFRFELSPSYAHAPHVAITMHPQHGAHIILRRV
ncbi:cytochrome P450 CYP72A616-like [Aristolochia californica]|uniref:cytochrome P450 CYP72A616-like n=1 Tax=Aristolochia californica TaxID=171875 RepID=UPI0035DA8104